MIGKPLSIEEAQTYYDLLQTLTGGGCDFVLKEVAAVYKCSERMLYDAALACIGLGFMRNEGGRPRKLTWQKEEPLTVSDYEKLEAERNRITKERDAGKSKNKRTLLEVLADYTVEEVREAYKAWTIEQIKIQKSH